MSFSAVVLAGGQSSRMGTDKAQLQLAEQTFQGRAIELVEQTGCSEVIVSKNKPGYLVDIYPGNGPLGGVYTALMHTEFDLLVVAVDMPLMSAEILITLVKASQNNQTAATFYTDHPLPVFIKNTAAVRAMLKGVLLRESSNKSIKHFLKIIGASELQKPTHRCFVNINTPDEFLALK